MRIDLRLLAGVGLLAGGLALWGAATWLRPLTALLPMTQEMVETTEQILEETRHLQSEMAAVQGNVKVLQRQEILLAEQEELTRTLISELERQGDLSEAATSLLTEILQAERRTLDVSREADRAGARTVKSVLLNAEALDRLVQASARVDGTSREMDGQMDQLLAELEGSAENFAAVERWKAAPARLAERYQAWWGRVRGWFGW